MRLLLDAHLSPRIAEQLRQASADVVTVSEVGLREVSDEHLLRWAVSQRRGVVTHDIRGFRRLHSTYLSRGDSHFGLIYIRSARDLTAEAIGDVVRALIRVLQEAATDDALMSRELWLDTSPET